MPVFVRVALFAVGTLACSPSVPPADAPSAAPDGHAFADALAGASQGAPGAWEACAALPPGGGRGECELEAARIADDRGAVCARVDDGPWRDECYFAYAESLTAAARWDDAVAACSAADTYAGHCARHVWAGAIAGGAATPALRARLAEAFPAHDAEIDAAESDVVAVHAAMEAAGAQAPGAAPEHTDAESAWMGTFRGAARIDTTRCDGDVACIEVARAVYVDRFHRAITENADNTSRLCAHGTLPRRLLPEGDPVLTPLAAALRAEACAGSAAR